MDDKTLFRKIAQSDGEAFVLMAEKYVVALNVFALRITGNREDARDIVQDAFVYIWENRKKINDAAHLRNYLYQTVRFYSLNHVKRSARSGRLTKMTDIGEEDISLQYIRTETARLLYDAIECLSSPTSEVIRLSIDGVKQEEIARQMNISLPTVKAHKSKGVKELRRLLGPLGFVLPVIGL